MLARVPRAPLIARQALEMRTVYQKKCNICSWVSLSSENLLGYGGAMANLESHMKHHHPIQKKEMPEESDEFKKATQMVDIPTTRDYCNINLSW